VPSGRQSLYANASYKSPFQPISPDTDPDASALTTGAVTEQTLLLTRNPGDTLAQVESELQSRQAAYQAQVTALTTWVRYGTFFNGTTWTMQGV
jgi:hypothetical protein